MKVLTKISIFNILKVGFFTALIATLMLMGVDLFKNLDTYTSYQVSGYEIFELTILYAPESFLLALGPSFLFATTYYLSTMHANNEMISVLNSGINYKVFLIPIIVTAALISLFDFAFEEMISLKCSDKKQAQMRILTFEENGKNDNSNVALTDDFGHLLIFAKDYVDSVQTIYDVSIIEKDDHNKIISRINAFSARWSEEDKHWIIRDCDRYIPDSSMEFVNIEHSDKLVLENFTLEPELFRNLSADISRMSLKLASDYLKKVKDHNSDEYASLATEFYKRIFSCLTPFLMIFIACSMNYRFKKNVLFFSIICSLAIAVVYYVIQMMTLMLADQGVIRPAMGMIIPFISVILLTIGQSLALKD